MMYALSKWILAPSPCNNLDYPIFPTLQVLEDEYVRKGYISVLESRGEKGG